MVSPDMINKTAIKIIEQQLEMKRNLLDIQATLLRSKINRTNKWVQEKIEQIQHAKRLEQEAQEETI